MVEESELSQIERYEALYAALGHLLSASNAYHNTLVIGMGKLLGVSKDESMLVFHPRSTGDLTATLKALIKYRVKQGHDLPVDKICQEMAKVNELRSRTNHIHGHMTFHSPKISGDDSRGIVSFSRPDISGGKFSINQTNYYSLEEMSANLTNLLKHLRRLRSALGFHEDEIDEYLNLLREFP